jgi:hypothetical protein
MDDLPTLKASLAGWDMLGDAALAAVLLGIALVSVTQFEWLIPWAWLARFPRWSPALGKIGAMLLIVGFAGEIWAARNSRALSDRVAAEANKQAAAAIERAKALEKDAAQLRLQLARLKWRVITPDQQATLVAALKDAPRGPVTVFHGLDDEPYSFALQVRDALKAAGFDPALAQSPPALNLPGTFILVTDLQHPPRHALPLQTAFREIHVELDGQQDAQHVSDSGTVVILIGARRP